VLMLVRVGVLMLVLVLVLMFAFLTLLLLLLLLRLHPLLCLSLEMFNELRHGHAHLLGINGKLSLHMGNLLRAGHHGHLPALGRALGRRGLHRSGYSGRSTCEEVEAVEKMPMLV
jgi:hypothetical protein